MTLPATIDPRVYVSWDGSGTFTGDFDDVTPDVLADPGVSIELGKDGSRTLDPPKVASAGFALTNDDGTYSQERADSPVYQFVTPGRPVLIQIGHGVADVYDGSGSDDAYDADDYYDGVATYDLARAAIDDISQSPEIGNRRVEIAALGVETILTGSTVTVAVMTSPRVDQCVTAILDAVGWPADKRAVSIADTTLLYWWCDDRDPWSALLELLQSEGPGAIYVDSSAVFHFENRNYRATTTRSTTSQATFFDRPSGLPADYDEDDAYDADDFYDGATSGLYFTALSYDPGYRNIYNRAVYTTRRRTAGAAGTVIWTYGDTLALGSGESITLIARPTDPFQSAITPVSPTDYTASGGTVSVSLSATSGLVAFVTVTATGGTPTVSGLQLRATPLTVVSETTVQNSVDASGSIAKFSPIPGQDIPRVLTVNGWPEIDRANAQAVCDAWVSRYMVQRPAVMVEIRNADGDHIWEILNRQVSDRITLYEENTGLAADVWINGKAITIEGAGGSVLRCRLACEKVDEIGGSLWDAAVWDAAVWAA